MMLSLRLKLIFCSYFLTLFNLINCQSVEELIKKSEEYLSAGHNEKAVEILNKAILIDSGRYEVFLNRAIALYHMGNYDLTIRDCYSANEIKQDLPEVYLLRGKVCMVTRSYGGAILFFGKALKYTNESQLKFEAYLNRGKSYQALNRIVEANNDYHEAYLIDSNPNELLVPMAEVYLAMSKTQEALLLLNKIIEKTPDYAPAYDLLGQIAIINEDYQEAIRIFEKITTLRPNESSGYTALADAYRVNEEYEKALDALNHSIMLNPSEASSYKIRGLVYFNLKDNEKGCNSLFKSMQLGYFEKYGYDLLDLYITHCESQ